MPEEPVVAYHLLIRGRVQGVGFRFFAQECAESLGVSGYVKNLPDGRVEAFAQGPQALVEELVRRLRKGPPGARVDEVVAEPAHPSPAFEGFRIRYW